VNLIIGKNDSGKTAFMEALRIADHPEHAAHYLVQSQRERIGRAAKARIFDFDRFWRPIFPNLDARIGVSISALNGDGRAWNTFEAQQGNVPDEVITGHHDVEDEYRDTSDDSASMDRSSWSLDLKVTKDGEVRAQQQILSTQESFRMPPALSPRSGSAWITTAPGIGAITVGFVSELKQRNQDGLLLELLRDVDRSVTGIELLAPGGDVPELFVRTDKGAPLLPLSVMGEGFQRCLELGAAAAVHGWPMMFIDEIENGLHHLVLERLWRWLATTSRRRDLQLFATTHSEECIYAACRAFSELGDDGLRVIRLDRLEGGTRASIYDRTLIETAERTGTELRG
jgi:ABC-type molybdenum transport system ATPase subunit/photorepair protein PhrA